MNLKHFDLNKLLVKDNIDATRRQSRQFVSSLEFFTISMSAQMKNIDLSILKEVKNSHFNCKEFGINPNSRVWQPLKIGRYTLEHRSNDLI
jgi:hypothetical protein